MTAQDVLVAAKGYLLNQGWHQGGYGRDGGPRCLVGAMASVAGVRAVSRTPPTQRPPGYREACDILEARVDCISWFNDDDYTSFADVIALLDEAILAAAPAAPERELVALRQEEPS